MDGCKRREEAINIIKNILIALTVQATTKTVTALEPGATTRNPAVAAHYTA